MSTVKILGILVLIAILGLGGYYVYKNSTAQGENAAISNEQRKLDYSAKGDNGPAMMENASGTPQDAMMNLEPSRKTITVKIINSGFSPSAVNIKKGDSVTWVNESASPAWPASAFHPTHTAYPSAGGCLGSTFDACKGLATGESWTFKFDEVGSWKYHDHLDASVFGTVNVAE